MSTWSEIKTITEFNGGELYRRICVIANTPIPSVEEQKPGPGEVVVRQGYNSPYAFAARLRSCLDDENALIMKFENVDNGRHISTAYVAFSEDGNKAVYQTMTY